MSEMKNTPAASNSAQIEQELIEFARLRGYTHEQAVALIRPRPAAPKMMSDQIDQLATALALCKGQLFSPIRNKHLTVERNGKPFNHRYTSLDVINDMLRLPLFENGLSILHLNRPNAKGALFMASRLLHKSGQYMDSVLPIIHSPKGDSYIADGQVFSGPQKLGSLLTYAKRYNICALMDIAGADDDDANIAEGNIVIDHEYPVEPNAQMRVLQDRYARLVSAAANARDPAGIGEVLQRWQKGYEFWNRMRVEGDLENWDRLMDVIPAAIERVHGKVMAVAFHDAATASRNEQIDIVRALWESEEGLTGRAAMKALNQSSYGMLFEHLRVQAGRVENEEEEAEARRTREAEQARLRAEVAEEGSPFDGALLEGPATIEADTTFRQVANEFGEFVTDVMTYETDWARAYVHEWENAGDRAALREFNADGLAWAERFVDAQVILMQGLGRERFAPPATAPSPAPAEVEAEPAAPQAIAEPVREVETPIATPAAPEQVLIQDDERQLPLLPHVACVTLHMTARGTPDLSRYLRAVKISLDQTAAADLARWQELNLPTADGLPRGTQLEVMGVLARRKQTLGVAA